MRLSLECLLESARRQRLSDVAVVVVLPVRRPVLSKFNAHRMKMGIYWYITTTTIGIRLEELSSYTYTFIRQSLLAEIYPLPCPRRGRFGRDNV